MRPGPAFGALVLAIAAAASARAEPIAACALPAQVSTPTLATPRADEVHADVRTAAYLLSLIWSPEECRSHGDSPEADTQCRANHFGFTVHGLWPNGPARYHPRFCRPVAPVDAATVRANLCMTPSAWLIEHEWAAHGACGWETPAAYFAQERRLRTALDVPDLAPNPDGFLTAGQVRDAFVRRNPAVPRDGLDVHVGKENRLEEVRVCYDLRFRYAACLSGTGAPDAAAIRVTPQAH
ncbi:MAG: ribonuclease T [Caulobacteraceae bacterium]|nr:ribonuclease T [Caulobacter sp.]